MIKEKRMLKLPTLVNSSQRNDTSGKAHSTTIIRYSLAPCIPLAYIIRKEENVEEPLGGFADFHQEMIAQAPLHGTIFQKDARTVYQLITSFTNGTAAEEYIKA